jgi:XTP/dITP diphosphohydrolase
MTTFYLATGNPHKVEEIQEALAGTGVSVEQAEVDIDEIQAPDVADVARRKVLDSAAALDADRPVIVDDTGLYVRSLSGFPGSQASFFLETCGNEGLLTLMDGRDDRQAYFKTCMAIYEPSKDEVTLLTGRCDGTIATEQRGDDGFGYDTVFIPEGHDRTFAEDPDYKMDISHRSAVIEELVSWVEGRSE